MYDILVGAMIIVSILLVIVVLLQPSKSNAASNLTGGADALFGQNKKIRGLEAALLKFTIILAAIFMGLALVLAKLSS